jgi:nucleotide-binding universal stress UspA family protein
LSISNVLVPTDFSEGSAEALDYARQLCRTFGARLHLLHVLETTGLVNVVSANGYAAIIPDLFDDIIAEKREQLGALLTSTERRLKRIKMTVLAGGNPAREIERYAADERIDLIVIGTHGRTGLPHFLLGSVAEGVVREAGCPVITVRPHATVGHSLGSTLLHASA